MLGRQWVNCPQKSDKAKPPPSWIARREADRLRRAA
jgi:hypothetical protein